MHTEDLEWLAGLTEDIPHWKASWVVEEIAFISLFLPFLEWQEERINIYTGENKQDCARRCF